MKMNHGYFDNFNNKFRKIIIKIKEKNNLVGALLDVQIDE